MESKMALTLIPTHISGIPCDVEVYYDSPEEFYITRVYNTRGDRMQFLETRIPNLPRREHDTLFTNIMESLRDT
jgi:hypothetical protein